MKYQADKAHTDHEYKVGSFVYVKLQPYRQKSVVNWKFLKLSAKYFGPYKILEWIGAVAYRLEFPPGAKVHLVFHISQLKQHLGHTLAQSDLPLLDSQGFITKEPSLILDRRMNKHKGLLCTEVLVQWKNSFLEDATWENLHDLQQ